MTAAFRCVVAFLLLKLTLLIGNMEQFPVLTASRPGAAAPGDDDTDALADVSLLVPMRDEADVLLRSLPGLLSQAVGQLVILDDGSSDGSLALARLLAAGHQHAQVVVGGPPPAGWVGKSWACHQLGMQATGSILMFCDADVLLLSGAVAAGLQEMRRQRADVFSVFPRQITRSWAEHLLVPLIDDVLLCLLPFGLLSVDVPAAATANGTLLAFTRDAYDEVDGFTGVRDQIVEDVMLARRTRLAGLKLGLALGGSMVSTRMYTGYAETVAGLGRGLLPTLGGHRLLLGAAFGWHVLAYTAPVWLARRHRRWLLPVALGMLERLLVEAKTRRGTRWQAALTPLSPLAATPVVLQAMRRRQRWKGRDYA